MLIITSNGASFVFSIAFTKPCCSTLALLLVSPTNGHILSRHFCQASLHLLCMVVLYFIEISLHWYKWSPFLSHFCLQSLHVTFELPSHIFILRHLSKLKRNRLFGCLLRSSDRGRSRRPCPSFPSIISSMLCLLSSGSSCTSCCLVRHLISSLTFS